MNCVIFIEHARFQLTSTRSGTIDPRFDIPEIEVTFTNGVKQKMVLRHYNAIPNSDKIDHSRLCNYLGHLQGDELNTSVAVTGCFMGDESDEEMHITLLSQHSPNHKSFIFDKNGKTKHIEIRPQGESRNLVKRMQQQDYPVRNKEWEKVGAKISSAELKNWASNVPPILTLKIRIGYQC